MQKITAQIIATNKLDLDAERGMDGKFRGVIKYAQGAHRGELIIRSHNTQVTRDAAIKEMEWIVQQSLEAVEALGEDVVKVEPLSEEEYQAELKRQLEEEARAKA